MEYNHPDNPPLLADNIIAKGYTDTYVIADGDELTGLLQYDTVLVLGRRELPATEDVTQEQVKKIEECLIHCTLTPSPSKDLVHQRQR